VSNTIKENRIYLVDKYYDCYWPELLIN